MLTELYFAMFPALHFVAAVAAVISACAALFDRKLAVALPWGLIAMQSTAIGLAAS